MFFLILFPSPLEDTSCKVSTARLPGESLFPNSSFILQTPVIKFGSLGKIPWHLELKAALAATHRQLPPSPANPSCEIVVALFANISHRKAEEFFLWSQPTSTVPQSIPTGFFFSEMHPMILVSPNIPHCLFTIISPPSMRISRDLTWVWNSNYSEASGSWRKQCEGRRSYCQERIVPGDHSNSFLKWLKKKPLSCLLYMIHSHNQSQLTLAGRRGWESGEEEVGNCCPRCRKENAGRVKLSLQSKKDAYMCNCWVLKVLMVYFASTETKFLV